MFKYTVAAYHKIVNDLKMLAHVFTIVVQSLMILYMTYSAIVNNGSRAINITLGALTLASLLFYLFTYGRDNKKVKRVRGLVSRGYAIAKLTINAVSLASIVYSIYVGASDISALSLVITPLMIIMWVLQVLFQFAKAYAENRLALLVDGIEMDVEFVANPIKRVKNVVHDFLGEEREAESGVSEKNRRILTKQAEEDGAIKKEKRSTRIKSFAGAIRSRLSRKDAADEDVAPTDPVRDEETV